MSKHMSQYLSINLSIRHIARELVLHYLLEKLDTVATFIKSENQVSADKPRAVSAIPPAFSEFIGIFLSNDSFSFFQSMLIIMTNRMFLLFTILNF